MALSILRNIQYLKPFYNQNIRVIPQLRTLTSKSNQNSSQIVSNSALNGSDDPDKPIEFLKSNAAKWKAHVSRSGADETGPWYQPYVISISLTVFMVYFCFLREENDVDLEFNRSLYDRISGLEEKNLEIVLEYNKQNNIATSDIETRLTEIRSSE